MCVFLGVRKIGAVVREGSADTYSPRLERRSRQTWAGDRTDKALLQDDPAVEAIGESLQRDPRDRIALGDLPEGEGHPPVSFEISVVEGPYSVARRRQDVAPNDVEAEAQDEVELVAADGGDILRREELGELAAELRPTADHREAIEVGTEIHRPLSGDLAENACPLVEAPKCRGRAEALPDAAPGAESAGVGVHDEEGRLDVGDRPQLPDDQRLPRCQLRAAAHDSVAQPLRSGRCVDQVLLVRGADPATPSAHRSNLGVLRPREFHRAQSLAGSVTPRRNSSARSLTGLQPRISTAFEQSNGDAKLRPRQSA